jgi:hypothetical protein
VKKENLECFFFYNNMMYINIDFFKTIPLAMTNLSQISIIDIKLMSGPMSITHLVERKHPRKGEKKKQGGRTKVQASKQPKSVPNLTTHLCTFTLGIVPPILLLSKSLGIGHILLYIW